MSKLAERLQDPSRSGVYRTSHLDDVTDALRGTGLDYAQVQLGGRTDKEALLRATAGALQFPAWFGANWDALEDCLTDLSWRPGTGQVVAFEGFGAAGDDFGILLDVLSSVAAFWRERGRPFFALVVDPGRSRPDLPNLYRES